MATGMTAKDLKLEVSADGSTWVDASGYSTSVKPDPAKWKTADVHYFGTDTPTIYTGKKEALDVTCDILYTETSGEARALVATASASGATFYIRWSPAGGASGDKRYACSGPVSEMDWPGGEASVADPIMVTFKIHTATITESTVV